MVAPLVIVDDFNVRRALLGPNETDAVLVIDADAVLSLAVALECFEMVRLGSQEIVYGMCSIQHLELSLRNSPQIPRQGTAGSGGRRIVIDVRRCPIAKPLDHTILYNGM
jgi:hypothetical protein